MYTLEDVYKTFPSGCTEDYKILRAFEMGKQTKEKQIEELEKENAELRTVKIPQLERKIASIRGCHSVDVKKLNARTEQVERLKKENAELKAENQKWKDEWQEQVQKATDEGYARTLQTIQLTKAKEIIKKFLDAKSIEETCVAESEAEQFLSEVEK